MNISGSQLVFVGVSEIKLQCVCMVMQEQRKMMLWRWKERLSRLQQKNERDSAVLTFSGKVNGALGRREWPREEMCNTKDVLIKIVALSTKAHWALDKQ